MEDWRTASDETENYVYLFPSMTLLNRVQPNVGDGAGS